MVVPVALPASMIPAVPTGIAVTPSRARPKKLPTIAVLSAAGAAGPRMIGPPPAITRLHSPSQPPGVPESGPPNRLPVAALALNGWSFIAVAVAGLGGRVP